MSTVATSSPPMIANAIGPQKTVNAIGIMPSTRRAGAAGAGPGAERLGPRVRGVHGGTRVQREIDVRSPRTASFAECAVERRPFWAARRCRRIVGRAYAVPERDGPLVRVAGRLTHQPISFVPYYLTQGRRLVSDAQIDRPELGM